MESLIRFRKTADTNLKSPVTARHRRQALLQGEGAWSLVHVCVCVCVLEERSGGVMTSRGTRRFVHHQVTSSDVIWTSPGRCCDKYVTGRCLRAGCSVKRRGDGVLMQTDRQTDKVDIVWLCLCVFLYLAACFCLCVPSLTCERLCILYKAVCEHCVPMCVQP